MSRYLQHLPGGIAIRDLTGDSEPDPIITAVSADELLAIVQDFRERQRREAESRASFSAKLDRLAAQAMEAARRRSSANRLPPGLRAD